MWGQRQGRDRSRDIGEEGRARMERGEGVRQDSGSETGGIPHRCRSKTMRIKDSDGRGGKYSERRVSLDQIIHFSIQALSSCFSDFKGGENRLNKRVES